MPEEEIPPKDPFIGKYLIPERYKSQFAPFILDYWRQKFRRDLKSALEHVLEFVAKEIVKNVPEGEEFPSASTNVRVSVSGVKATGTLEFYKKIVISARFENGRVEFTHVSREPFILPETDRILAEAETLLNDSVEQTTKWQANPRVLEQEAESRAVKCAGELCALIAGGMNFTDAEDAVFGLYWKAGPGVFPKPLGVS